MSEALEEVNVSVAVPVEPLLAFTIFTEEIDLWWQRGPVYRTGADSSLRIEPFVGGRFLDVHPSSGQVREIGRVQVWQPGERFCVEWRGSNFAANEVTLVEATFTAEGPGCRVAVRHSGWEALAPNHPARHGQTGAAFVRFQSRWWADVLTHCQAYVARRER